MDKETIISICISTVKVNSFYKYALAMLQSMKENSNLDCPIVIQYDTMTKEQRNNLARVNRNVQEFRKIPVDFYQKYNKNSSGWFVLEGWAIRDYQRVIILDSDFICQGDISGLSKLEVDIAMCREASGIFNGGLVVASQKLLNENWYEKMMSCDHTKVFLGGNRDKWSKDQKLINFFLKDRITALDRTYNWLVDSLAHKAKMIHYIYKPLYALGRKQLIARNPTALTIWERYYNKAEALIHA